MHCLLHIHSLMSNINKWLDFLWTAVQIWLTDLFWVSFLKLKRFSYTLQEKEAFIISQLKAKGLTLRDEDGEDLQAFLHILNCWLSISLFFLKHCWNCSLSVTFVGDWSPATPIRSIKTIPSLFLWQTKAILTPPALGCGVRAERNE